MEIKGDFVKNYRALVEWRFYKTPSYAHLWQHLIRKANWKPRHNINGQKVERGEVDFSLRQLQDETGIKLTTLRGIMKNLKKNGEIDIVHVGTNRRNLSIISIVNYEIYQSQSESGEQYPNTSQTVGEHQAHNFKKEKKGKKEKNNTLVVSKNDDGLISDVIDYLNQVTGKKFKSTGVTTKDKINARAKENYSLQDFKKVIDIKFSEWRGTPQDTYLRPETLFGNKFEGYLQQAEGKKENGFEELLKSAVKKMGVK